LKRLAPNLREAGWIVEHDRSSKKRTWSIRRGDNPPAPSSEPSPDEPSDSMPSDADWFGTGHDDADDAGDASAGTPWNPDRY
jgi:hypothetical protein